MSKRVLYDLKDMLCAELDEIGKKGEMSAGDLETVHKLTDTIKNIDKITMLEEGVSNVNLTDAMSVLDELMSALYVANPKVYNGVMRKLERLQDE